MMTAAEVDYVFNLKECSVEGYEAAAFATAGLSNHVIAGEDLVDYEENSRISARRAEEMRAGTINIGIVASVPMTIEGKINLFIPLVEAKGVAMSEHGFAETGTTSDAMAVFSPAGEDRVSWTGTGSWIGIAAARAVSAAVGCALDIRNEHPNLLPPRRILGRMGLDTHDLFAMSGTDKSEEEYSEALDSLLSGEEVRALADLAWFAADRADSLAQDGNDTELRLILATASDVLDVPVERPLGSEAVSLGAAYAAGLAVGYWSDVEVLRANWHRAAAWEPAMDPVLRERERENWGRAVNRSYGWVQSPSVD